MSHLLFRSGSPSLLLPIHWSRPYQRSWPLYTYVSPRDLSGLVGSPLDTPTLWLRSGGALSSSPTCLSGGPLSSSPTLSSSQWIRPSGPFNEVSDPWGLQYTPAQKGMGRKTWLLTYIITSLSLGFHLKTFPPFTWPVNKLYIKVGNGLRGIHGYPQKLGTHKWKHWHPVPLIR